MQRFFMYSVIGTILLTGSMGCNRWGEKVTANGGEVYYTGGATKEEADKAANLLVQEKIFTGEQKTVQLVKEGNNYQFRLVVKEEYRDKPDFKLALQYLGGKISREALNGAPVVVHLCDEHLKTLSTANAIDYGTELTFNNGQVFYKNPVTKQEAEALGEYLVKDGYFDGNHKSVQLVKDGDQYACRFVIIPSALTPKIDEAFKALVHAIGQGPLKGAAVQIHYCDAQFETLRVLKP